MLAVCVTIVPFAVPHTTVLGVNVTPTVPDFVGSATLVAVTV
jgi:hypothetical protein